MVAQLDLVTKSTGAGASSEEGEDTAEAKEGIKSVSAPSS